MEWFLSCSLLPVSMGDLEVQCDRLPSWCLTRKCQTGLLTLHFWERLKLQLDKVLNLGLVSSAFSMSDAILGLWVFSSTGSSLRTE